MTLIIIGVIVVVIALVVIAMYNGLVRLNQQAEEAWSDITVQLKRRVDLIPNLVNTVKGYASHEKTVFEDVTKARASVVNAQGVADTAKADEQKRGDRRQNGEPAEPRIVFAVHFQKERPLRCSQRSLADGKFISP